MVRSTLLSMPRLIYWPEFTIMIEQTPLICTIHCMLLHIKKLIQKFDDCEIEDSQAQFQLVHSSTKSCLHLLSFQLLLRHFFSLLHVHLWLGDCLILLHQNHLHVAGVAHKCCMRQNEQQVKCIHYAHKYTHSTGFHTRF